MAKRKTFNIGNSLKQALTDTVVSAQNYKGELHIEVLPLRLVELDPDNPRELSLSFTDMLDGLSKIHPDFDKKNKDFKSLETLSESIKDQGIINPIMVYKHGENYRLIAGERRTLASLRAGKVDIPARILNEKPDALKLSLLQWAENIEREDLALWERIKNLKQIYTAYLKTHNKSPDQITAQELSELVSCSIQQANNYRALFNCSQKLSAVIRANLIKNIEKAALIAKAPKDLEEELIKQCVEGATLKNLKNIIKANKTKPEKKEKKQKEVNFGNTPSLNVAKLIIESVLSNHACSEITKSFKDMKMNSHTEITKTFKQLIKSLEKLTKED